MKNRSTSRALWLFASASLVCTSATIEEASAAQAHVHDKDIDRLLGPDGQRLAPVVTPVFDRVPAGARARFQALQQDFSVAHSMWNPRTGVPTRIYGAGIRRENIAADDELALRVANGVVFDHLALLAPGSTTDDFRLVSNETYDGVRSIGWQQTHQGMPVIGGQISVRLKGDHLNMLASEALPNVRLSNVGPALDTETLASRALSWVADGHGDNASIREVTPGHMVLPVLDARGGRTFHEVIEVIVDTDAPIGRWSIYVETSTGDILGRRQTLMFGQAPVRLRVPVRGPYAERMDTPANRMQIDRAQSGAGFTSQQGFIFVNGSGEDATLIADGEAVTIIDESGPVATDNRFLSTSGVNVWDESGNEFRDAQLTTFAHANIVNDFAFNLDPDLAWITDGVLQATVNINDVCNAFSDGDTINFFRSSGECQNTGLLADVVYHEYGHSLHIQSIIPGVGQFEGALSEGYADFLAATIVSDSGMGRGFFYDESPLRQLNPVGFEWRWPEDTGEVHDEGRIIGGTLWDLRTQLSADYGVSEGRALTNRLFYSAGRRASDIPTMYPEVLVADDDDGDLSNGTPNICTINEVFGAHGLFSLNVDFDVPTTFPSGSGDVDLSVAVSNPYPECPVELEGLLRYRPEGDAGAVQEVELVNNGDTLSAVLPGQPDDTVLEYQIAISYSNGSTTSYPLNVQAPWYEMYFGDTTPLYCTSFNDPTVESWTLANGAASVGWEIGTPGGLGGDPSGGSDDATALGINHDGTYQPGFLGSATSPVIDVAGYDRVRLQYMRWLGVEDGFYDRAGIFLNESEQVWSNVASPGGSEAAHHRDGEWRFHDIDLSDSITTNTIDVSFTLTSDFGLEYEGWNIDEFCIVAVGELGAVCGNGVVEAGETCDDGNTTSGDGCSATCQDESAPPLPPTTGGDEDDGGTGETGDGKATGDIGGRGCGCDARDDAPPAAWSLLLLGGLGLLRRRRTRA